MNQDERNAIIDAHAKITHRYIFDTIKLAVDHGLDPMPLLYEMTTAWMEFMEPFRTSDDPNRTIKFLASVFLFAQPDE